MKYYPSPDDDLDQSKNKLIDFNNTICKNNDIDPSLI
jgi:hypothetical protein